MDNKEEERMATESTLIAEVPLGENFINKGGYYE
jgi:hypothetical protein